MRILFVSNFFPPHGLGGQAQSCQEVVEALQQRDHETFVLTSMHGNAGKPAHGDDVARVLYLEMELAPWRHMITFFTDRKRRERHNVEQFDRCVANFAPDVVFVWGMWNIARSFVSHMEMAFQGRILYRFADYWPTLPSQHVFYWQTRGRRWFSRIPKAALGRVALKMLEMEQESLQLRFEHAYCISEATKQVLLENDVPIDQARIIYNGITAEGFAGKEALRVNGHAPGTRKLLYAGRLSQEKGIDVAIRAVGKLVHEHELRDLTLSVAGAGEPAYEAYLRSLVRECGVERHARFLGPVPAEKMAAVFREHSILLVPSVWAEPFGRVILEAMASGVAVIASDIGGPAEIVKDGENGLLFEPRDVDALSNQICELVSNDALRSHLAENGLATVRGEFTT